MRGDSEKDMRRRFVRCALLLCLFVLLVPSVAAAPTQSPEPSPLAARGVIDLRGVNWQQQDVVLLNGEWEVYWQQLLNSFGSSQNRQTSMYMPVPSPWKKGVAGQTVSNHGFATYRLRILFDEEAANKQFALYMPSVASAYELWIDGQRLGQNGVVGKSREEMVPQNYSKVVVFRPKHPEAEVVLQVSNFVQRNGGVWEAIRLGPVQSIILQRESRLVYEALIAGSLFVMGIYHLILYPLRRKEKSALYFSVCCMAVSLRTLLLGETLAYRFIPVFPWSLGVKLEYLTSFVAMMALLLFVRSQYPQELKRGYVKGALLAGGILGSLVLLLPTWIFTEGLAVMEAYLVVNFGCLLLAYGKAAARKRTGSLLNGIGLLVFFLSVIGEILFYANLSPIENSAPLGLLVFLVTQMINLSRMIALSFERVEQLSLELRQINESLEEKVSRRTHSLKEKNEELHRMEESRRKLLSNIAHELGTPLTSIQGFIKAMIDGVVKSDDSRYLHIIYDKTIYLHRIITDLFELSRMEARQIRFHYQSVMLLPFFRQLYEKYRMDIEEKGLSFHWETSCPAQVEGEPVLWVDPVRIEQVVANLLVNSQKYTPAGGAITLRVAWECTAGSGGLARICVRDTGSGMDAETLPFVFDRFYKGKGPRKGEGAGLGLAICKEIVDHHQGNLRVESEVGAGSAFTFSLPVRLKIGEGEGERDGQTGHHAGRGRSEHPGAGRAISHGQ